MAFPWSDTQSAYARAYRVYRCFSTYKPTYLIMYNKNIFYVLGGLAFLFLLYYFFLSPPANFLSGTVVQIEPGMGLHSISLLLKRGNVIRSRTAFEAFVIFLGGDKRIKYSEYLFETPMSAYDVALWIVRGERYRAPVVVTIPEGFSKEEIANVYSAKLINFNKDNFLATAPEGYLFPDTYYFLTTEDEKNVIDKMTKNFEKKIASIRPEIDASSKTTNRTEREIIIMASILEKEAKGDNDRELISGILWKRISNGMPLQVDAAPDTYKTKGLPKNPIGNPGLEAIHAAIYPKSSPYLYYLHDKQGITHYAENFAEHRRNIVKYLKPVPY